MNSGYKSALRGELLRFFDIPKISDLGQIVLVLAFGQDRFRHSDLVRPLSVQLGHVA